MIRRELRTGILTVLLFTVLLGVAYPLLITGVSQVVFPGRADGSRVERDGKKVGSKLIAQDFKGRREYFQSRPSVTEYNPAGTFFNNQGPNQAELAKQQRGFLRAYLRRERPYQPRLRASGVPADAVTTNASGVDPHISKENAHLQARRVARVRQLSLRRVLALVDDKTAGRGLGVAGNPGVNVLELNLALDKQTRQ